MIDLSTATATDALASLARGDVTSVGLLTAQLERVERFNPVLNAVVALDSSQRGKLFVTADSGGEVWVRHATSEQVMLKLAAEGADYETIALAPRENGIVGISSDGQAPVEDKQSWISKTFASLNPL